MDLQGILAFIGGLSALVLVHELGHFSVAKAVGVRVENFSIFMGQPLLAVRRAKAESDPQRRWAFRVLKWHIGLPEETFQHGETEYAFRWIPFGGYVKMAGQSDVGEADVAGEPWEFTSKPLWARAAVVAAGPLMNVVLAIALFAGLNATYGVVGRIGIGPSPSMSAKTVEPNSIADSLGIVAGTVPVSIDGIPFTTWEALEPVAEREGPLPATFVLPSGDTLRVTLDSGFASLYSMGVTWEPHAEVGTLIPLEPAAEAELREGDRIVSVNANAVTNWSEMSLIIRQNPGRELELIVERDGRRIPIYVTPSVEIATFGVEDGVRLGVFAAIGTAFSQTWDVSKKILRFIQQLITRAISPKYLAGPVGIFQMTGIAAEQGWATYLAFLALLSANLAVVNLLPLAVLDGGHLVFFAYEGITGKQPSQKQQGIMQQIGVVILLSLLVMVTIIDLGRLF